MTVSQRIPSDLFDSSLRPYADRLLAHCIATQKDPEASDFALATLLLQGFDRTVRFCTVVPIENRVQRDALMCAMALHIAELAL